jgi:hypothetical protein
MRLLLLLTITLFAFTISAQDCVEGEGLITTKAVKEASCLTYRTVFQIEGTQYIVALSSTSDSVTVARALDRNFLGKETWGRTEEGIKKAVFIYNSHLNQIERKF